jgi:hypothetical protein
MKEESIIEMVRRCLALATSSNEHEAAAAAAKANELLLKYHISLAQVEGASTTKEGVARTTTSLGASDKKWRRYLASVVANYNFCRVLVRRGRGESGGTVWFVGKPTDTTVAIDIFNWLAGEISRLAQEAVIARKHLIYDEHPATFRISFCWGATSTANNRFYEERRAQMAALPASSVALVVRHTQEVDDFMNAFGRLRSVRQGNINIREGGHREGRAAGQTINLRNQRRLGEGR